MRGVKNVARFAYRLAIVWIVDTISILITAAILPGFELQSVDGSPVWVVAVAAALLLGIVNLLIRPAILLLALPLGLVAVSMVGFFVNALVLRIAASLLPGFVVENWLVAFVGGLVLALVNTIITTFLTIDDEGSFYESLVERLAKRRPFVTGDEPGLGLVMVDHPCDPGRSGERHRVHHRGPSARGRSPGAGSVRHGLNRTVICEAVQR